MLLTHALRAANKIKTIADSEKTYFNSDYPDPATTQHSFLGANIGDPQSDRMLLIVFYGYTTGSTIPTVSSVTVNGASATSVVTASDANNGGTINNTRIAIYRYSLATGTTADILVNYSSAPLYTYLSVYAVYGLNSTTPVSTATSTNTTSFSLSANVQAGGFTLAGFSPLVGAGSVSSTSNLTLATNNDNTVFTAYNFPQSTVSPQTHTITLTGLNTTDNQLASCLASFR